MSAGLSTAEIVGISAAADVRDVLGVRPLVLTRERLCAVPPPRVYLLETEAGEGVLPKGKVALFGARGGTGKSWALTQLAVAVATGGLWFGEGGWRARQGRVLLMLAEEEAEEAQRRLHWALKAAGLLENELALDTVARNVIILPLAGHGVALTHEDDPQAGGGLPETPLADHVRAVLRKAAENKTPFDSAMFDPLARFAGGDVEKDNAAATRFVQVLETFAAPECGSPAVLVSHHLRKQGKEAAANLADLIRGASGLVDGVRWAAVLGREKAGGLLRLEVPKTNYSREPEPLALCRPEDGHGTLRVATPEEIEGACRRPSACNRSGALKSKLLELIAATSDAARGLTARAHARYADVADALKALEADGTIINDRRKWRIASRMLPDASREADTHCHGTRGGAAVGGATAVTSLPISASIFQREGGGQN